MFFLHHLNTLTFYNSYRFNSFVFAYVFPSYSNIFPIPMIFHSYVPKEAQPSTISVGLIPLFLHTHSYPIPTFFLFP
jgi:hypothetical protein